MDGVHGERSVFMGTNLAGVSLKKVYLRAILF